MSRVPHKPTDETSRTVRTMSAYGIPQSEIAKVIEIDEKTLRKYYRRELDTAEAQANAKVAQSLYNKALGDGNGAVSAAIFWLKTRAGWRESPQAHEFTGRDGGPIQTEEVTARDRIAGQLARLATGTAEGEDTSDVE